MAARLADIQRWMNEQKTLQKTVRVQQHESSPPSPIPIRPGDDEVELPAPIRQNLQHEEASDVVYHTPLSTGQATQTGQNTQTATPFKKTGSQHVLADCPGCDDFRCVREWRTIAHAEAGGKATLDSPTQEFLAQGDAYSSCPS